MLSPHFSVAVDQFDRNAIFDEAGQAAREVFGRLSGRPADDDAARITQALQEFKAESVRLPDMPDIVPLSRDALQKEGMPLDYVAAELQQFDFYQLRFPITLWPRSGYMFDKIECQLAFSSTRTAEDRPLAHSIFPTTEYDTIAKINMELDLGLSEKLEFTFRASGDAIGSAGGTAKAKGGIGFTFPLRTYQVKQAIVEAEGVGSSEIFWRLSGQRYVAADRPQFSIILKIPKSTSPPIDASGILVAYRSFNLWGADLSKVFSYVSDRVRNWFQAGAPVVNRTNWDLTGRLSRIVS